MFLDCYKLLECKINIISFIVSLLCYVSFSVVDSCTSKGYLLLKQIDSESSEMPVQNKLVSLSNGLNGCPDLSTYKKHVISFLPASVEDLKRKARIRIATIIIPFVIVFNKWISSLLHLLNI